MKFVRVCVVGLGFISGFWIAVGVDPEAVIANAFAQTLNSISPGSGLLVWLMPIIGTVSSVFSAYALGGWLGLVAVGTAFISGILILTNSEWSIFLLVLAIIMGMFASNE